MDGPVEIRGINHVQRVVEDLLGWTWRPFDRRDYGLDAIVEIGDRVKEVYRGYACFFGVQVKSGSSYLQHRDDHIVIRLSDTRWSDYWLDASVAIIIIVFDPETNKAYWAPAPAFMPTNSGKSLVARIPKDAYFDLTARAALVLESIPGHLLRRVEDGPRFTQDLLNAIKAQPHSASLDTTVRRILFSLQDRSLEFPIGIEPSLLAVDTTLEDFGSMAWSDDESYRESLRNLLRLADKHSFGDRVIQIYSITSDRCSDSMRETLCSLATMLSSHGIRVGFVRREELHTTANRDFAIVNNQFVLECTVARWADSVPQFSKSAVNLYKDIFYSISKSALWLTDVPSKKRQIALRNFYS